MNFLEQLATEWYEYNGYFVRSNIHFGKRAKGGWTGEIDVAAFHPKTRELVHLEASTDSLNWDKRIPRIKRKFGDAARFYGEIFPFAKSRVRNVVVIGHTSIPKKVIIEGIELKSIPTFLEEICDDLRKKRPLNESVPENLPLLRAIQFAMNYQRK